MSKKTVKKQCAVCGKQFAPKSHNSSVCSDKCRKALKAKHDKCRHAAARATTKKPVRVSEKIELPVAKQQKKHTIIIHRGDNVFFGSEFAPLDVLEFATALSFGIITQAYKDVFFSFPKKDAKKCSATPAKKGKVK